MTAWRWTQSPANFSPNQLPANRERYREFGIFARSCSIVTLSRGDFSKKIGFFRMKRNRERTQSKQGMGFPDTHTVSQRARKSSRIIF
jgi:hypothetical protein